MVPMVVLIPSSIILENTQINNPESDAPRSPRA
jgi:hypothetical protein